MTKNHDNTAHTIRLPGAIFVLLLALLFLAPACYTILKHPMVIQEDYTRAETQRCGDCHMESDLWGFHHPHKPYHSGYGFRDPWVYYYDVPWWYNSYWFYDNRHDPDTVPLRQRMGDQGLGDDRPSKSRGTYIAPPPAQRPGDANIRTKAKTKDDSTDDPKQKDNDKKRPTKKKKKDN